MDLERTIKIADFAIEIQNSVINYQANPQKNSHFQRHYRSAVACFLRFAILIGRNTGIERKKCEIKSAQ